VASKQRPPNKDPQTKQHEDLAQLIPTVIQVVLRKGEELIPIVIQVAPCKGEGFFVVPNDHVDVIQTVQHKDGNTTIAKQSDVFVLAVNGPFCNYAAERGGAPHQPLAVTLGATPEQAAKLTEMKKTGTIKLVALPK
jgi:Flp pilus assembly protein CpaB